MDNDKKLTRYENRNLRVRDYSDLPVEYEYDYYNSHDERINIREILDIFIKRKWIIVCFVLIFTITALIASFVQTPIYRSVATIEISPITPRVLNFQEVVDLGAQTWDTDSFYETQYRLMKSNSFLKNVVQKLGLFQNQNTQTNVNSVNNDKKEIETGVISYLKAGINDLIHGKEEEIEIKKDEKLVKQNDELLTIGYFASSINIIPDNKSTLVNIEYQSPNPTFAAKAANTIVDEYINWLLERKHNATKSARDFLKKQLNQAQANLERTEENLLDFAKSVNIVSLDENLNLVYTQLSQLNQALSEAETERLAIEAVYEEIKSGNFKYLPNIVNDESMVEVRTEYTALKSNLDNLSVIYGPNYPEIKQIKAQIARVQAEMGKRAENVANSIKSEYKSTLRKEKLLRERTDEQNKRTTELNDKAIQYKILAREVDTNKSIYESLLQRLKETEVTSSSTATNVQVVDYASISMFPFKPNIKKNLMMAIFLGLLVGCFIAYALNYIDNTIKDENDVKNKFPVPFLGAVPLLTEDNLTDLEKSVYNEPNSLISEAFRVIRTSLLYSSPDQPPKSVLITSTQPLEGKTTSSSNLALSLAQSGLKVVLVDSDLRKPRLHKFYLKNGKKIGLSSFLVGNESLEGVIQLTDIEGLSFIPSGPIPPNPAELVGSKKMKELLDILEEDYDQIILDGTPIMGFADSRLLSRLVDGVLLVTSVGITQKQLLRNSIDEIRKVRGKIIGTVVNRLETTRGNYGYNYYYYYSDRSKEDQDTPRISSPNA